MELPRLFRDPFRRLPEGYRSRLIEWFASRSGMRLLAAERRVLDDILPCIFGYHAAQVCAATPFSLLEESRILGQVLVGTSSEGGVEGFGLIASPHQLPFAADSLDLLLLHHGLDFEDDPHQVLREAARTVIPGGALVVVGFNPWSLFGFLRVFLPGRRPAPWFARAISPHRVSDWLNVLDFRVDGLESGYHLPPLADDKTANRLAWLDFIGARWWPQRGTFYVLVARKSVAPLMPVRRQARQVRPLAVGVPLATGRYSRRNDL